VRKRYLVAALLGLLAVAIGVAVAHFGVSRNELAVSAMLIGPAAAAAAIVGAFGVLTPAPVPEQITTSQE